MSIAHLPSKRCLETTTYRIGGMLLHLGCSLDADGRPVEVWLDVDHKEGAPLPGLFRALGIGLSRQLRAGISLADAIEPLFGIIGDPSGPIEGHPTVTRGMSVLDAVAQILAADWGAGAKEEGTL